MNCSVEALRCAVDNFPIFSVDWEREAGIFLVFHSAGILAPSPELGCVSLDLVVSVEAEPGRCVVQVMMSWRTGKRRNSPCPDYSITIRLVFSSLLYHHSVSHRVRDFVMVRWTFNYFVRVSIATDLPGGRNIRLSFASLWSCPSQG